MEKGYRERSANQNREYQYQESEWDQPGDDSQDHSGDFPPGGVLQSGKGMRRGDGLGSWLFRRHSVTIQYEMLPRDRCSREIVYLCQCFE